jgi:hypothetical protein
MIFCNHSHGHRLRLARQRRHFNLLTTRLFSKFKIRKRSEVATRGISVASAAGALHPLVPIGFCPDSAHLDVVHENQAQISWDARA